MRINILSILCGLFISADYFGYQELRGSAYFWCWVCIVVEAFSPNIIRYKEWK